MASGRWASSLAASP